MDTFMASGTFVQGRKALFAVKKAMQSKHTVDRRTIQKIWKQMLTVVGLCSNPRLNITNSPPCILDILPDTKAHLQLILEKHNDNFEPLNECPYFRVMLENLSGKCRQIVQLFKDSKEAIYNEETHERRSLTKFALIFNHMYSELKALYPNGVCVGKTFPITKSAAAEFWHKHFGLRYCIPWRDFVTHFETEHTIRSNMEVIALKSTIDLTCNDHVTVFEFDVFTLLFQPWSTIVRNWNVLAVTHPGYQAFLTYDEVKDKLLKITTNRVGSYLYRLSCTRLGQWAIGHITPEGNIVQTIPQNKSLIQALVDGHKEGFYLHPMGQEDNPDVSDALVDLPTVSIHVTQEQYELYMEIDSTFELCKICTVNKKDVKVEPCCHLVCSDCLEHWLESNGSGCPFCRMEIKSTETVVVHPFYDLDAAAPQDMPPETKIMMSADDTACPSSASLVPERPPTRHATFSSTSSTVKGPPIPPVPWRKGSVNPRNHGGRGMSESNPLPPVPLANSPLPPHRQSTNNNLGAVPPPPVSRRDSISKDPRAPLPAVPCAASGGCEEPTKFIPPIEYESTNSMASALASSIPAATGTPPSPSSSPAIQNVPQSNPNAEYSMPNRSRILEAMNRRPSVEISSPDHSAPPQEYGGSARGGSFHQGSPPSSPSGSRRGHTKVSSTMSSGGAAGASTTSPSAARSSFSVAGQLKSMGYKEADIQKAIMIAGEDVALASKILDSFKSHEKKSLAEQLVDMGYSEADVKKALSVAGDNRDLAVMILEQFGMN